MKKRVAFRTLGCRLNQFETDSLVTDFYNAGYDIVSFSDKADVYIVNTCTVTNQGDRKSKHAINQAVRASGDDSILVVAGCLALSQKEYLENRKDITYIVDNKNKGSVFSLVDSHFKGELIHPSALKQDTFNYSLVEKSLHTRSAIKIQDGCDNFCTFCIVPKVRGRAISRSADDVLENVHKSVELGNKEMVLTGVNISRYDFDGLKFDDLVEKILTLPGDFRVRVSSIEPEGFTDKFLAQFENPKLCPHLHLCLQSGSDKVLMRMRRTYSIAQYMNTIDQFRKHYPGFNFTTDVIVGFPGETEDEFLDTCKVVQEAGFSHIHTFKYSRRSGTLADRLTDQISEQVKSNRSKTIREIADTMKLEYRKKFIGKEQILLVERNKSKGGARGYGEHYVPILIQGKQLQENEFYKVRVTGILDDKERSMTAVLQ
ncbi:MAG: tRNA (N(6)-L-threonylcarbamoyladenosine(37)-C(2))-methylthiotransferase MtaB [Bacteroidales bacterium]|nr:tRNA (N(6)-L-threonylcarbamoyladenosine(37)-C(2))-methylthiotransferase MtaB [Bacteroidales bacterium]